MIPSSALSPYFDWLAGKLSAVEFGTVSVSFVVSEGQLVRVDREIKESDKIRLDKVG